MTEKDRRVMVTDGSSWPTPDLATGETFGLGWVLRYGEPTRTDLLKAAAIIDAYGYLVAESTREKRDLVCREVRAALRTIPSGSGTRS